MRASRIAEYDAVAENSGWLLLPSGYLRHHNNTQSADPSTFTVLTFSPMSGRHVPSADKGGGKLNSDLLPSASVGRALAPFVRLAPQMADSASL